MAAQVHSHCQSNGNSIPVPGKYVQRGAGVAQAGNFWASEAPGDDYQNTLFAVNEIETIFRDQGEYGGELEWWATSGSSTDTPLGFHGHFLHN